MKIYTKKQLIMLTSVIFVSLCCALVVLVGNYGGMIKNTNISFSTIKVFGNQLSLEWEEVEMMFEEPEEEPVEEIAEVASKPQRGYSMEERELLAQMMYAEEGIFLSIYADDYATAERVFKLAGSVILNRRNTGHMGAKSIADVLYAKGQYADRTKQVIEEGQNVPEVVYTWADDLLTNGSIAPDNMIFQAEFPQGSETYEQIGNQYFCCK